MVTKRNPAFYEGQSAYEEQGAVDLDNPYVTGTDEAMDWEDGRSEAEGDAE